MNSIFLINSCQQSDSRTLLGRLQCFLLAKFLEKHSPGKLYYDGEAAHETALRTAAFLNLPVSPASPTWAEGKAWLEEQAGLGGSPYVLVAGRSRIISILRELLPLEAARQGYIVQPEACVNILRQEDGEITVTSFGETVHVNLSEEDCIQLLTIAGVPKHVVERGQRVADLAERIARFQQSRGADIHIKELRTAALLEDILAGPDHAQRGAELLDSLGFRTIGEAIRSHHTLPDRGVCVISAPLVLFLADRLVDAGGQILTLEQYRAQSGAEKSGFLPREADQTIFAADILELKQLMAKEQDDLLR